MFFRWEDILIISRRLFVSVGWILVDHSSQIAFESDVVNQILHKNRISLINIGSVEVWDRQSLRGIIML